MKALFEFGVTSQLLQTSPVQWTFRREFLACIEQVCFAQLSRADCFAPLSHSLVGIHFYASFLNLGAVELLTGGRYCNS